MGKFIKTKTSYVFRKEHQKTKDGVIYERDYATITPNNSPTNDLTVYNDGIFKFVVRAGLNGQKKHRPGKIIKDTFSSASTISKQSKLNFNPNYTSIRDFAYYGSAIDLIRGSITDIILNFPAEIYFSNKESDDLKGYYVVENDFNIDIISKVIGGKKIDNPLRYFCESLDKYEVIFANGNRQDLTWSVENSIEKDCRQLQSGTFVATATTNAGKIFVYYQDGEYSFYCKDSEKSGNRIRPKQGYIDDYFDNLDDFEKVLLNKDSNPLYLAVFSTPRETNTGNVKSNRNYIWPNKHGYNPDIVSGKYQSYIDDLITLATYHDEYDSDILWRRMTHDSIKKLDWTYTSHNSIEFEEDLDTSRINPIIHLYGRQYDDIKRSIDNIKSMNNITYDKKNNMPDYFLPNALSMSGWDVKSVNPSSNNLLYGENRYSGKTTNPTSVDTNIEFLRRMKINSRYLLQKKGTRDGIISLLGLFGFKNNKHYTIEEYYELFNGGYKDYTAVTKYNIKKGNYPTDTNDELWGLPLREVIKGNKDYVIPWYDSSLDYDKGLYFQMYGGWGKTDFKYIDLPELTTVTSITGDFIYGETNNNLKFTSNLDEMLSLGRKKVKTGDICYVVDISNVYDKYSYKDTEPTWENFSHYFILRDIDYSSTLGWVNDTIDNIDPEFSNNINNDIEQPHYGWVNVSISSITGGTTDDAKKVIYLESIIDNNHGNNPHVSNRYFYDNGKEYIDRMKQPFKGALDAGYLENMSPEDKAAATAITFNTTPIIDNKKCWYFTDTTLTNNIKKIKWSNSSYITDGDCGKVKVNTKVYNPETNQETTNDKADEAAANSVVNVKNLILTFKGVKGNKTAIDYINDVMLPYVTQMIPSTTILEIKYTK